MKYLLCFMVLALVCMATGAFAVAYTEQWEMDAAPNTVAGSTYGNLLGVGASSGFTFAGGVGTFNRTDNNQGYYATGSWGGSFTLDMRVRDLAWTAPNWPGYSKDFSVEGGGAGRGVQLDDGACFVNSAGHNGTEGDLAGDWQQWVDVRIIVTGGVGSLYDWRGNWNLVAQSTLGGSGWSASYLTGSDGFSIGSLDSSTTTSNFELDYARVKVGASDVAAVYSLYEPPATPEPGSMLALATGLVGMAGLALRRRRA